MIKKITLAIILLFTLIFNVNAEKVNFFNEAKNLYENEKYEDSKFLFQRNIVYNPKDSKSYLYLAKIFKNEENKTELEKNINTILSLWDCKQYFFEIRILNLHIFHFQKDFLLHQKN